MNTIEFAASCVLLLTFLQIKGKAANPRLFDSAAHYWPFDRHHGIVDIKTNITGDKHGKIENIVFKGPGNGFLHTSGKAWVDLGNFTGSCLAEPARCTKALTVFLWLKYYPNKRRRYLLGTSSHLTFSEGFAIYKDSDTRANNSIVIRVNNGQREWTGYLTLKPNVWSHVMFTWDSKLGLALFENCNQMALVSGSTLKTSARNNRSNILEHYLSLSGAQIAKPELGVKASYEDLTVFYRKLESHERNWICLNKLEAPQLNSTCKASTRWLSINWTPPPMTYDILNGYNVWYWGDPFSNWTKLSLGMIEKTTLNLTDLDPGSSYKFRVQNAFRFGVGKSSQMIECRTKTEVLDPPLHLTVEMKSFISVLLKWTAPPRSHEDVAGYKIAYSKTDSNKNPIIIQAGPMTSFLLDGLQNNTVYKVQVTSYGDRRFFDSAPAVTIVRTDNNDKSSVKETSLQVTGPETLRIKWKKPHDKYKVFSYRVFVKWNDTGIENMLEVYDGNATSFVYSIKRAQETFHVMAYVVKQIPLIPIVDPPVNVTIVSFSWSFVVLNWTSPFHGRTIDFADLYRAIAKSSEGEVTVRTTDTHARIDGLKQLTNYSLNAQAWNGLGYGPFLNNGIPFRTQDHDECADDSHMCHVNAVCTNNEGSYECECEYGYVGDGRNCEEIPDGLSDEDFCPKETFAGIEWRRTLVNRKDETACPEGTVGVASRKCTGSPADWELPDLGDCVSKWMSDLSRQLNNPNVSVSLVANQLVGLTDVKTGKLLYPGDLKLLVDVIGVLSQRGLGTSKNESSDSSQAFVKAVVGTASNILDKKNLQSWKYMPKDSQTKKASSLIDSLDGIALDMANSSQRNSAEMDNVVMSVNSLENVRSEKDFLISQQDESDQALMSAVSFPASVLRGDWPSTASKPNIATLVSYKTLGSLLTPRGEKRKENDQNTLERQSINSAIASVNLHPLTKKVFKDPVVITLRHSVDSEGRKSEPSCVFLETDKNTSWSEAGCEVSSTNTTHTVCHCYHLTSFAVLMSVKQDVSTLSKEHQRALTLITYVGVSVSVVALCLAFLTFYFFRFSKSARTFIHKNLSVALILAQLLFMFGVTKTSNKLVCKGIAIALHYFFLVAFAWMALEGVMLYLMLVKVFHTKTAPTKSKKIFFCLGWGIPVIIVVISGVMFHEGYGTSAYCWLSLDRGFIWSFVGPVLLVLAFNFICLGITFNVMAKSGPSSNKKRTGRIRRWSKACMLLTCILGLTWLFGVFYINQESLFMAYCFTIFNTLQGLFIFLFHCIGDEKVRREYSRVLCCREEDKRFLLTKPSNSETSKSESRSTRSHIDNFKSKNQTINSSADSLGTIESKRNTFVVHVSDGQVRVRGVATDEFNRNLVRNRLQSGDSASSFEQPSGEHRNGSRHSTASAASEESENEQSNEVNEQETLAGGN